MLVVLISFKEQNHVSQLVELLDAITTPVVPLRSAGHKAAPAPDLEAGGIGIPYFAKFCITDRL
jgi:hypothetical protein